MVSLPWKLFFLEVTLTLLSIAATRQRGFNSRAQAPSLTVSTDLVSEEERHHVSSSPVDPMTPKYPCGQVPRGVLVKLGLMPPEWKNLRCPRGHQDDALPGEKAAPSEQEFFACGLVSTRKFVVWTPHVVIKARPQHAALFRWARHHTTCDFSQVDRCKSGFLLHHGSAHTSSRCLPQFDITAQPTRRHALVETAFKLFEATSVSRGIDKLSPQQAHMAFGVVLGYPKYATRDYLNGDPRFFLGNFDERYAQAVAWVLRQLKPSCEGTELYKNIASWPGDTNTCSVWLHRCSLECPHYCARAQGSTLGFFFFPAVIFMIQLSLLGTGRERRSS